MRLTSQIKLVLRLDKKKLDGTIPLYFSIRVGPTTNRIPTGKYTLLKDWDQKKNCLKNHNKLNELLDAYLSKKISDWKVYMQQLENMGKTVTLTSACAFFQENTKVTFYSFFQEQMELWSESKEYSTLKSYKTTYNVLKEFAPKLNFGDITYGFVEKFDYYLGKTRGNGIGGKHCRHKCFKAIINEGIKKGYFPLDQYPYRHFKIKSATGNRQPFSIQEVKELMDLDIPQNNVFLNRVKDLFLFGCFTGLRYSDVMNLRWENIDYSKNRITVQMTKTKKPVTVPLIAGSKEILDKYGKSVIKAPTAKVMPQMTNQVLNRELKVLIGKTSIEKPISYHVARHTFATNLLEAGTNILHLKDLLGHSKITETQIYAKSLQSDLHSSMDNLAFMYDKAVKHEQIKVNNFNNPC